MLVFNLILKKTVLLCKYQYMYTSAFQKVEQKTSSFLKFVLSIKKKISLTKIKYNST